MNRLLLLPALLSLATLGACGQTGALYLPDERPAAHATHAAVPPPASSVAPPAASSAASAPAP